MSAYKKEQLDICLEGEEGKGDFFKKNPLSTDGFSGLLLHFSPDGSVPLFYEKESAKFFFWVLEMILIARSHEREKNIFFLGGAGASINWQRIFP